MGAQMALADAGIKLYAGVRGSARCGGKVSGFRNIWTTIRMPAAIATDIITMAIADTITAQIITAMAINI